MFSIYTGINNIHQGSMSNVYPTTRPSSNSNSSLFNNRFPKYIYFGNIGLGGGGLVNIPKKTCSLNDPNLNIVK